MLKRSSLLLFCLLSFSGLSLPASAQSPLASYHNNFDSDTVGSAPSGTWLDQSGGSNPPIVRASSPYSAPNMLSSGGLLFYVNRATPGSLPFSSGDIQFSYTVHNNGSGYQIMAAQLSFASNNLYKPIIYGGTSNLYWYNSGTGLYLNQTSPLALPSWFVDGAKVTQKEEYDPSTTGGPSLRIKLWQYGTAEPGGWTLATQDTNAGALTGGFNIIIADEVGGSNSATSTIDDYFEGPVGSTFTSAPATQTIAPNNAAIIYTGGTAGGAANAVWNVTSSNAISVDAGNTVAVPYTGSQLNLKTNEGDGNQWIRYHIVTPGATAAAGPNPAWVTVNLPAGAATTVLDSADPDTTLQHTCYLQMFRHGYTDVYGSSGTPIPTNALNITGWTIDASGSLGTALAEDPFTTLSYIFGDSIVEGYGADPTTGNPDATYNWVSGLGKGLKTHLVRIAHGGWGTNSVGSGGFPAFATSYGTMFYNASRLTGGKLPGTPAYCFDEFGVNGSYVQSDIIAELTHLRSILPSTTKLVKIVPLGGQNASALAADVAAYITATGDTNTFVVNPADYGLNLGLTGSGPASFRGLDDLHPTNFQSGDIAASLVAGTLIQTMTSAPSLSNYLSGPIKRGR